MKSRFSTDGRGIKTFSYKKIREILKKYPLIRYAFVFGSAIKKKLLPGSDIDILIGPGIDFPTKTELMLQIEKVVKRSVDIVAADNAPCELVLKALSEGKALFVNDPAILKNDYFTHFYRYEESLSLRQLRQSSIKRRYAHG